MGCSGLFSVWVFAPAGIDVPAMGGGPVARVGWWLPSPGDVGFVYLSIVPVLFVVSGSFLQICVPMGAALRWLIGPTVGGVVLATPGEVQFPLVCISFYYVESSLRVAGAPTSPIPSSVSASIVSSHFLFSSSVDSLVYIFAWNSFSKSTIGSVIGVFFSINVF